MIPLAFSFEVLIVKTEFISKAHYKAGDHAARYITIFARRSDSYKKRELKAHTPTISNIIRYRDDYNHSNFTF